MAKLLTVFGATGQQGGALIDYVLRNSQLSGSFSLRGVTRDATKPASIALKNRGVEIIEADLNDKSTLNIAVAGSYAVFAITNYWEPVSAEVEISQGRAIADAAVTAGATQIIWSSLPSGEDWSPTGEPTGPTHFVSKAVVEKYIRTLNIKSMFFMPGWFMQNHLTMMRPQKKDDGTYEFPQPWPAATKLPLIDIGDAGKFIAPALLNPDLYHQKRFSCATAFYSLTEMTDTWTNVTGKAVRLKIDSDDSALTEEQRKEVKNSSDSLLEYGYFGPTGENDVAWTIDQLSDKKLRTWEEFVRDNEPWFS